MEDIMRLEGISYSYFDKIPAVCDISLGIKEGEGFTIIGANGSGKSTLLQIMNGLIHQSKGKCFFRGNEVSQRTLRDKGFLRFFRERVGYVFQDSDVQLFCPTVMDELLYGPLQLGIDGKEALERAFEVMHMLNIEDLKDRPSYMLSGGEKKRAAIGSVLTMNPEVLLLDEPTTGVDPRSQVEFVDLINELRHAGKTIVTVTHDLGIIEDISDRTVVIGEDHRLLTEGNTWDVMEDTDMLLRANLIHRHVHRHRWYVHEHSHFGTHGHEHVVLREPPAITNPPLPPFAKGAHRGINEEVVFKMTEPDKLKKLLEHWAEHNEEHAKTYLEWAEKASASGDKELSSVLKEIAENTKKMDGLFEKAKKALGKD
ncbi:MAG: nickel ABC transporter ATP-binding protein [Nitrospirae bacterium CG01_land_8_20_14_3_00_44_22]|nr:MAG: nickel ABC transporter ATP-binding protein [Nitrospirae bacterium CG01_land_8_20_14_3_00_44_22]